MRKLSVVTSLFDKLALVYRSVDCLGNIQGKKIWMFFIWQTPSGAPMESSSRGRKQLIFSIQSGLKQLVERLTGWPWPTRSGT